jgi:uncharacterized membrane protein
MSARVEFLAALRTGLRGVPAAAIDDAIADYQAHFDEGAAANRTQEEIATALGDPLSLAEELRLELRVEKWETAPSPRSAWQVIAGAATAGLVNTALLAVVAPFLLLVMLITIASIAALLGAGFWMLFAGTSLGLPGGMSVALLGSVGLLAAAVSLAALLTLGIRILVTALGSHVRLHSRLLPRVARAGAKS